jgi:hypothetical protein
LVAVASDTGGGDGVSCAPAGFATRPINLDWTGTTGNISVITTGFGANTALVVKFRTPPKGSPALGNIDFTERGDPQTYRQAVLSTEQCHVLETNEGVSGPVYFSVGTEVPGYPTLSPNTLYYYTLTNIQNGLNSCFTTTCNARVQLIKPRGL